MIGEKPYTCTDCGKQFKTSSDWRRHERIHTGERRYGCKLCGQKFIQGWHLKQHERMHSDYRPFTCELCGKKFRGKDGLKHHLRAHSGIKNFTCQTCGKAFSTKKYLGDHQIIHTSEKPFKCKTCPSAFNQVSNLKRHMLKHSNRTKYKCRYCPKEFKYINSWRYHEGTHTAKMLHCEKCASVYRSAMSFKKHKCEPDNYIINKIKSTAYIRKYKEKNKHRATKTVTTSNLAKGLTRTPKEIGHIVPYDEDLMSAKGPIKKNSLVQYKSTLNIQSSLVTDPDAVSDAGSTETIVELPPTDENIIDIMPTNY